MRPYWFHPDALEEADEAAAFHKQRRPGLERRFLDALNDAITRIRRNPFLYRRVEGETRKCRLMRFTYGVLYRVDDDGVEIVSVMHLRREPGYWKSRV